MTETALTSLSTTHVVLIFSLLLWTLPWKGVALWKAAKNSHKWWFIFFLVINTVGLLEIFYIFVASKWKKKEKIEKETEEIKN
jgi:hypothetical protein